MANAATIINLNSVGGSGFDFTAQLDQTIGYSTVNGVTYDRYNLFITAFVADPVTYVTPTALEVIEGTWSFPGGITMPSDTAVASYNSANDSGYTWDAWSTNITPGTPGTPDYDGAPLSAVRFCSDITLNGAATWARTQDDGHDELFTSMEGSWYSSSGMGNGSIPILVGTFYTPTGNTPGPGTVIYTGVMGFSVGGNGVDINNSTLEVTPVPEPASLVLLASGLVGLLAYAWKRRR
jgi:hypothetical protein